jgi:hypothetical protein
MRVVTLLFAILVSVAPAVKAHAESTAGIKSEVLATAPAGWIPAFTVSNADGTNVAFEVNAGGGRAVIVNGQAGPTVEAVSGVRFPGTGQRFAYRIKNRGRFRAVIDGNLGPEFERGVTEAVFSDDGAHVAYVGGGPSNSIVICDGREVGNYEQVGDLQFVPIENTLVYVAKKNNSMFVVVGQREGEHFASVSKPVLSKRGAHVAYEAWIDKDQVTMILDGVRQRTYRGIMATQAFSPDGKRFAYAGWDGQHFRSVLDGIEGTPVDSVQVSLYNGQGWFFSPSGEHLCFAASLGPRFALALDGKIFREHSALLQPIGFNSNGELIYLEHSSSEATRDTVVAVNGTYRSKAYAGIGANVSISSDGKHWAFCAANERSIAGEFARHRLVLDGEELAEEFDHPAGDIQCSPDGKVCAMRMQRGGRRVKKSDLPAEMQLPRLPASVIMNADGYLVINRTVVPEPRGLTLLVDWRFVSNVSLSAIALQNDTVLRLAADVQGR